MPVVGIRQLARNASAIIRDVARRKPAVVTDRGKPVGVIYPFDEEDLEDYILANSPELASGSSGPIATSPKGRRSRSKNCLRVSGSRTLLQSPHDPSEARSA